MIQERIVRHRSRRSVAATASLAVLAATALSCTPDAPESSRPPNVLLISIDSLRADHLGCYGYRASTGSPTSPRLDRLASEGVLFEHAQSTTSWTMPAHTALLCGLDDLAHGAVSDEAGPTPKRVQLPQVLSDAGLATAGFFSGPYLDPRYGFGEGFDVYENVSGAEGEIESHRACSAKQVSDRALGWLDEWKRADAGRPFFLFLHYFDVHYDYAPPEEGYARRFWPDGRRPRLNGDEFFENPEIRAGMDPRDLAGVIASYDGEILWTDEQMGRVLDRIGALGIEEETLVVVVSDHGDEFFEHGTKGHRQNLFETTLHVPLILRLPGRLPAGKRVPQRVSLIDVAPTILDLAGAFAKADFLAATAPQLDPSDLEHGMAGRSLLPIVAGRETSDRDCTGFLANRWQNRDHAVDTWALWTGSLKVVVSKRYPWLLDEEGRRIGLATKEVSGAERAGFVFDLAKDPGETNDLAGSREPRVLAAIDRFERTFSLDGRLARCGRAFPAGRPPPPLTPAQLQKLANIGYVAPASAPALPPGTKLSQVLPPPPAFPRRP